MCGRIDRTHTGLASLQFDMGGCYHSPFYAAPRSHPLRVKQGAVLLLLTFGTFLVHGYHPYVEDAEIYLPGIEKTLHPELFPRNAQFFESHAGLTLFPNLMASLIRISHLPMDWVLLLLQFAAIFLLLLACWQLSGQCFTDANARWAGVGLMAALLTLPVAGTCLYVMDQYTNPRNLAAFACMFAVTRVLQKKYVGAAGWLIFAFAVHPLMPVYTVSFCVLLVLLEKYQPGWANFAAAVSLGSLFEKPTEAYHQAAVLHSYHYVTRWEWYELLGAVAPIAIFWWFSRIARARRMRNLDLLSRALIIYDIVYLAAALALAIPARFEGLARLQPMRSLHLLYMLMIVMGGGLLGQFVLQNKAWRWFVLFVPLCLGMHIAQHQLFSDTAHLELPWQAPKNAWVQAFLWIRDHTPVDAYFALDPDHMELPGEDQHGFRAIAERSMLADRTKDSGAVSMFPPLAETWLAQVQARQGWKNFQADDFRRLRADYGADWVVVQNPAASGLECPYSNLAVSVCRIP